MGGHSEELNVWGGGQLLAFSGIEGQTEYQKSVVARTETEGTALSVLLPGTLALRISEGRPLKAVVTGDWFDVITEAGRTRGAFVDTYHLLIEGPVTPGETPVALAVAREGTRTLVGEKTHFDAAHLRADLDGVIATRRRWLDAQRLPEGLPPDQARAVIKALSTMKGQVYAPEGPIRRRWTTPDRWPHRGMWLWDSAFHAIGWRHVDAALAREMTEAVLDGQEPDGRIPLMSNPTTRMSMTQPPLLALATALVDRMAPDDEWIARMYPRLCRYIEWDMDNRDTDGDGLVEWRIDHSPICRSGESGMDNASRFDGAQQLNAPDFNAYLAHECEWLSHMATRLGRLEEAERWHEHHTRINRLMNQRLWSEKTGLYMDNIAGTEDHTDVLSVAGFLPMISGAASFDQVARLDAHLHNAATFGTELPVPTIAPRTSRHYAKDMWRGPVWVNMNWLVMYGLRRYGLIETAERIRRKTLEEVAQRYMEYGTLFEFFDDERRVPPPRLDRKGTCDPARPFRQVFHDYGWTATLLVDMAHGGRK